jgi:AraC-like DNA-binding protein
VPATILTLAAALNAALLALALGYRAWSRRAASAGYAATFLLIAASAVALIALDHSGRAVPSRSLAFGEGVLTLAAGPFFALFVISLVGKPVGLIERLAFGAPMGLYICASIGWPFWAAQAFVVERLVLVQMGFTAYAAVRVIAHSPIGARARRARVLAFALLAPMAALHLAQVIRIAWPDVEAVRDIVPLVGAVVFLALSGMVYFSGRVSALDLLSNPAPMVTDEARALTQALDEALSGALLSDAHLTAARAAAALGVAPDVLTQALQAVRGLSFVEYIQMKRIEAAKCLLVDAREARTSMEAIGLLVGFGSRSAFYKAFRDRVGVSPATFRRVEVSKDVQNPGTGQ